MSSEGQGNDGSALVGDGSPAGGLELGAALGGVPVSSRPPPPRKRTSTLQGAAAPPLEDVPTLSPSADAPPSLDALDSAIGFAQRPASSAQGAESGSSDKLGFTPLQAAGPASSSRGPLSAPPAPPRPRAASSGPPPAAAAPDATSIGDGPPPIPDIDTPLATGTTRDSSSGTNASRRRSRRTLKIPDDAVPTTTPAPPAVAPAAETASSPASMPMPAVLAPPSSGSAPIVTPTAQQAAPTPAPQAPPAPERAPIVTDDSIAIIRPMMIIAVGDSEPVIATPVAQPAVAQPAAQQAPAAPPVAEPTRAEVETTQPAAPSPIAAARSAATAASAPVVNFESTMPSAPSPLRSTPPEPPPPVVSQPPPANATPPQAAVPSPAPPSAEAGTISGPATERTAAPAEAGSAEAAPAEHTGEEIEPLEEIEPERDSGPSIEALIAKKSDEESLDEFEEADEDEAEKLSTTEEIPIVEIEVEQPKRPPPPPRREGPPSSPATPPQPPTSAAPASKPTAPASKPAPPTAKPETKKRPWWEEIFSEDFIRTMDQPKPSYVQREVNFIEESLGVEKGAVVLDLACGTGAHAVELASRGYSVVGFDLSLAMLARASDEAQERGQKLNFLQGDMREMAFEEMFDGIYCWSTSFGYFDEEKNLEVLARTHRALRHGGMLLIDLINRDFIAPRQPSLVWFEGDGCVCMDEMHVDFFTSRLKVKRTVMFEDGRTREVDYSIRVYNLHELGKMMHDVGFRVVQVTGHPAHPGVFFGSESPRIIILAERAD
ncbi:MAG: methyltransferase domain-containing protein [Polyangiaceae bacterium]